MGERPPFRRRLLVRLGAALALALVVVGVVVWLGVAAWSAHEGRRVLREEALALQSDIVGADGSLDPSRYYWDEPHHRFEAERIDPLFLQVFDTEGRLLRASDNVARFAPGAYPQRPLGSTASAGVVAPLRTFRVGSDRLYRATLPLRDGAGRTVGTVQVARFLPPLYAHLGQLALGLCFALGVLLAALLALVWAVADRVVRPLQAITAHAATLSAATLGERVAVPDHADRETAALAAALNGSLDRLDGAFTEMQRFTANAAHELQTPLTVLQGHVDVALRRDREPESYRDTLRVLRSEVDGMTQAVRGLLALARLDAGSALPTEDIDLAALARDEAEAARPRAAAKGLDLVLDASPTPLVGHPGLLCDLVRNLIDNAVKYTETGRVTVTVGQNPSGASVAVSDTGPGIAPDHLPHVTDRFWRADDAQHLPGSGLGLALADRIATSHGGRLDIGAAPGGGARVVATFPTADV